MRLILEIGWTIAFLPIAVSSFYGQGGVLIAVTAVALTLDRVIVYITPAADGPVFARRLAMGFAIWSVLIFVGWCIVLAIQWIIQ